MLRDPKSNGRPGTSSAEEREYSEAVKRSDSGQLSVSISDLSKTQSFKRDLQTLARIRQRAETGSSGR